ncbi:MAG: SDR family oxidoreductase [Pseudomonadota bacterium]
MRKLFIFGYGFSCEEIAKQAKSDFDEICGTSRKPERAQSLGKNNVTGLVFDGESLTDKLKQHLSDSTHLVMSISPGEEDPVLSCIGQDLKTHCPNLEWAGYLSTVGVYGNHDGEWVDEETIPKPVSRRSKDRVNAENAWLSAGSAADIPAAIFRLSGIYGPGRNAFMNIKKGTARRLVKPGQVFNRIHREDIGQAVALAMGQNTSGIFNITDDEPAPPQDVVLFAHKLMGVEPPSEMDFETADLSPMARSFYGENKRVSNAKSKSVLGMEYKWPDYRTSLQRMLKEDCWQ